MNQREIDLSHQALPECPEKYLRQLMFLIEENKEGSIDQMQQALTNFK
jgi:hypothetical protein